MEALSTQAMTALFTRPDVTHGQLEMGLESHGFTIEDFIAACAIDNFAPATIADATGIADEVASRHPDFRRHAARPVVREAAARLIAWIERWQDRRPVLGEWTARALAEQMVLLRDGPLVEIEFEAYWLICHLPEQGRAALAIIREAADIQDGVWETLPDA